MAEVLVTFTETVRGADGKTYTAVACGGEMPDGMWQGWLEFTAAGEEPIRSGRETTQPNRQDTIYWATGLTPVFLEGCLARTLKQPIRRIAPAAAARPHFDGPAAAIVSDGPSTESVLDPFSVYRKGEALLRRQLAALASWHLVNIIRRHALSDVDTDTLNAAEASRLIDIIVDGVRPRVRA